NTPHPDEAWRVVEFFTSEEAQRQFVVEYGYVPSRRSLFTDPQVLEAYDHYEQLLEVAEQAVLRPPIGQYAQASDILQRYLSSAITGQLTPEAAMERAAGETRRVLGTA
ncbi:MAG: ABC transporter substrate-binding protein, partial [Leptolyngbya sp. DLM2.Bin15]